MDDLVAFLRARLAADLAVAARATGREPTSIGISRGKIVVDPARVLAEVEAKRARLVVLGTFAEEVPASEEPDPLVQRFARQLLVMEAAPYADHPDFKPEWRLT